MKLVFLLSVILAFVAGSFANCVNPTDIGNIMVDENGGVLLVCAMSGLSAVEWTELDTASLPLETRSGLLNLQSRVENHKNLDYEQRAHSLSDDIPSTESELASLQGECSEIAQQRTLSEGIVSQTAQSAGNIKLHASTVRSSARSVRNRASASKSLANNANNTAYEAKTNSSALLTQSIDYSSQIQTLKNSIEANAASISSSISDFNSNVYMPFTAARTAAVNANAAHSSRWSSLAMGDLSGMWCNSFSRSLLYFSGSSFDAIEISDLNGSGYYLFKVTFSSNGNGGAIYTYRAFFPVAINWNTNDGGALIELVPQAHAHATNDRTIRFFTKQPSASSGDQTVMTMIITETVSSPVSFQWEVCKLMNSSLL